MADRGIRLSEKHGVNPAMGLCFWCGEEDGTILLLGRLPNDAEAPRRAISGYEPCAQCKTGMGMGITLIEVETRPALNGQKPIQGELYPTGRWVVVKPHVVDRMFTADVAVSVHKHQRAFIDPAVFRLIAPPSE